MCPLHQGTLKCRKGDIANNGTMNVKTLSENLGNETPMQSKKIMNIQNMDNMVKNIEKTVMPASSNYRAK